MANGGNIETLNFTLDLINSGTKENLTVDSATQTITLRHLENDGNGSPIYSEEGYWQSEIIDLKDAPTDFEKANIVFTNVTNSTAKVKIFTRSSTDKTTFSDWVEISSTNTINSPTRRYIQFKIVLYAGFIKDTFMIANFEEEDDVELFDNNHLLISNETLRVRNDFAYDMELESSTSEEYDYYRFKVERGNWTRINSILTEGVSQNVE